MDQNEKELMDALGWSFRDEGLLRRALTHPSVGKKDNQRLEFLGDAVLQYIMSDRLYREYPEEREGTLTHLRALLVCEAALSQVASDLGIGRALIMDRGEEQTGGREKPSVLCDAMEAVLAAVYLDGGMEAARAVVERCWPTPGEVSRPLQDSKGRLRGPVVALEYPSSEELHVPWPVSPPVVVGRGVEAHPSASFLHVFFKVGPGLRA